MQTENREDGAASPVEGSTRVAKATAYVHVVHELGFYIPKGGNPQQAQRGFDNAIEDVSMVPGEPHHG